jgi:hypothetical protein
MPDTTPTHLTLKHFEVEQSLHLHSSHTDWEVSKTSDLCTLSKLTYYLLLNRIVRILQKTTGSGNLYLMSSAGWRSRSKGYFFDKVTRSSPGYFMVVSSCHFMLSITQCRTEHGPGGEGPRFHPLPGPLSSRAAPSFHCRDEVIKVVCTTEVMSRMWHEQERLSAALVKVEKDRDPRVVGVHSWRWCTAPNRVLCS